MRRKIISTTTMIVLIFAFLIPHNSISQATSYCLVGGTLENCKEWLQDIEDCVCLEETPGLDCKGWMDLETYNTYRYNCGPGDD